MNKNPVDDLYQEVASVIAEMKRNGVNRTGFVGDSIF